MLTFTDAFGCARMYNNFNTSMQDFTYVFYTCML